MESRLYGLRSAVKNFGIERFKNNCIKATEGFNYVLKHFHEKQLYLNELKQRKALEMKTRGENAIKEAGLRATAQIAKATDMVNKTKIKASEAVSSKGRYTGHESKMNLLAEECKKAQKNNTFEK